MDFNGFLIIMLGVFGGYQLWRMRRAKRASSAQLRKLEEEWRANPKVQKLLSQGPEDDAGRRVFTWLKNHTGRAVNIEYRTGSLGQEFSESVRWVVESPKLIDADGPSLEWKLPLGRHLHLPSPTYHQADVSEEKMVYRLGWAYAWDENGSAQGLAHAVNLSQVENWQIFTFDVD
jgi:hypothetical protein